LALLFIDLAGQKAVTLACLLARLQKFGGMIHGTNPYRLFDWIFPDERDASHPVWASKDSLF
jgi:hypothetical protein